MNKKQTLAMGCHSDEKSGAILRAAVGSPTSPPRCFGANFTHKNQQNPKNEEGKATRKRVVPRSVRSEQTKRRTSARAGSSWDRDQDTEYQRREDTESPEKCNLTDRSSDCRGWRETGMRRGITEQPVSLDFRCRRHQCSASKALPHE